MINEVGIIYFILIVMLYLCVGLDVFNYIRVFGMKKIDVTEYCSFGVKYTKLVMYFFFGAIMLYIGFTQLFSLFTIIVHLLIGVLLVADAISGIVFKTKYGKKRK